MKTRILITVFALTVAVLASAQDIRYVGDKAVDLSPLRTWIKTGKGERPLQHWKEVRVESLASGLQTWPKCSIKVDGDTKTVFLRNLPKPTIDAFSQVELLDQQVEKLKDYVAAEKIRVRNLTANTPDSAPAGTPAGNQIRQQNIATANSENNMGRSTQAWKFGIADGEKRLRRVRLQVF